MESFFYVEELNAATMFAFLILAVGVIALGERVMTKVFIPLISQRSNKIFNILLFWFAYIFTFSLALLIIASLAMLFGIVQLLEFRF